MIKPAVIRPKIRKARKDILFLYKCYGSIEKEASEILKEEGYGSCFASDLSQTFDLLGSKDRNIVMIILDINLVVELGIEIYDKIKELYPNLPVVTTSTAGHYRPKLGAQKKLVKYSDGVKPDTGL